MIVMQELDMYESYKRKSQDPCRRRMFLANDGNGRGQSEDPAPAMPCSPSTRGFANRPPVSVHSAQGVNGVLHARACIARL
jgi:hypothetical protein